MGWAPVDPPPPSPEPCLKIPAGGRCRSPYACGHFGYCRERNHGAGPTPEEVAIYRIEAACRREERPEAPT